MVANSFVLLLLLLLLLLLFVPLLLFVFWSVLVVSSDVRKRVYNARLRRQCFFVKIEEKEGAERVPTGSYR